MVRERLAANSSRVYAFLFLQFICDCIKLIALILVGIHIEDWSWQSIWRCGRSTEVHGSLCHAPCYLAFVPVLCSFPYLKGHRRDQDHFYGMCHWVCETSALLCSSSVTSERARLTSQDLRFALVDATLCPKQCGSNLEFGAGKPEKSQVFCVTVILTRLMGILAHFNAATVTDWQSVRQVVLITLCAVNILLL